MADGRDHSGKIHMRAGFNLIALALTAIAFVGCGAARERPLSIKMYHTQKNITLDCVARDLGLADRKILTDTVETCARQLEKSGFVRQSSTP
jgi:hypothetical protein